MEVNSFWNKISNLYYEYELTGEDKFIILDMSGGMTIILAISSVTIGGDMITGLLDDGTEMIISIDEICTLRYNPSWSNLDEVQDVESILI